MSQPACFPYIYHRHFLLQLFQGLGPMQRLALAIAIAQLLMVGVLSFGLVSLGAVRN